jgi:exosortase/archaeosortase family protein
LRLSSTYYLLPLAWLWFQLINHLRVEWSVNPQYAYGWAVPLLCLYLIWRKVESGGGKAETLKVETLKAGMPETEMVGAESRPVLRSGTAEGGLRRADSTTEGGKQELEPDLARFQYVSISAFQLFSFFLLSFLYLPTRLIQEANPEWRLVSWALALEVVGITLLLLRTADGGRRGTDAGRRMTDNGAGTADDGRRMTEHGARSTHHVSRFTPHVSRLTFHASRITRHASDISAFCFSNFLFPILFFLVAVPWPTFLEAPLVQGLMRANVGATIELLGLTGVPAIQHGNVIEIANGVVGIDDACSGIRSLQAALMLSLFFGEVYRLAVRRRLALIVLGFVLAFLFNVGRILLLTQVAAAKDVGAVATWHDPAGVTILVACFLSLWLVAKGLGKAESRKQKAAGSGQRADAGDQRVAQVPSPASPARIPAGDSPTQGSKFKVQGSGFKVQGSTFDAPPAPSSSLSVGGEGQGKVASPPSVLRFPWPVKSSPTSPGSVSAFQYFSIFLTAWLILVEAGTELWYRSHEWGVPKTTAWEVDLPRDNPTFRDLPFSDKTKQFLRYDEGYNGAWQQGDGQKWQAIFLRWNPGRIAVHLAKSHTPEVCLTAAGRELMSQSGLRAIPVHGLQLPFRSYVVRDENGPLHVFYCLWEDRASAQSFRTTRMSYANRLAPVLAGRRNSGQRSLEVAIWGITDQNEADAALARELDKLIKVEK